MDFFLKCLYDFFAVMPCIWVLRENFEKQSTTFWVQFSYMGFPIDRGALIQNPTYAVPRITCWTSFPDFPRKFTDSTLQFLATKAVQILGHCPCHCELYFMYITWYLLPIPLKWLLLQQLIHLIHHLLSMASSTCRPTPIGGLNGYSTVSRGVPWASRGKEAPYISCCLGELYPATPYI